MRGLKALGLLLLMELLVALGECQICHPRVIFHTNVLRVILTLFQGSLNFSAECLVTVLEMSVLYELAQVFPVLL